MLPVITLSLFIFSALAQDNSSSEWLLNDHEGKYGNERALGDFYAIEARNKFALETCKASLEVFCADQPINMITNLQSCHQMQNTCGAFKTQVMTRFISKYGKGSASAHSDVLPSVKIFLQALKDLKTNKLHPKYIQQIMRLSGKSLATVTQKLQQFAKKIDLKQPPLMVIDFWGYFQQAYPQRPKFKYQDQKKLESMVVAFRYCEIPVFIKETNLVRDVLAQAIFPSETLRLTTADEYRKYCKNKSNRLRGQMY